MKVVKVEVEVNDEVTESEVQQIVEEKIKAAASHKFKKKMTLYSIAVLTVALLFAAFYDFMASSVAYMILGIFGAIILSFMGLDTTELIKMRKK